MKPSHKTLLKLIIACLLLAFLAHTSKIDFRLLLQLGHSPLLMLPTIALYFIIIGISAWRWNQLNRVQSIDLTYHKTLLPTYLGIAFNNLLPGGIGGDFFRFYFINKKHPTPKSVVMLSILIDRITGLLGIFIAVAIAALFQAHIFKDNHIIFYFLCVCLFITVCLFSLAALSFVLPKQLGMSQWLKNNYAEKKWAQSLLSIFNAIHLYRRAKITLLICLLLSGLIQALITLTCLFIANILNFPPLHFTEILIAVAVTQIANLIPLTPGGFGVGEMAFANTLILFHPTVAATYGTIFFSYRIIGILTYLPGMLIFVLDKNLLKSQQAFIENQPSKI